MKSYTDPEEEGRDTVMDSVVQEGWRSLLQKRRWRLLIVVAGTILLSTLQGVLASFPHPIEFPEVLYFHFLMYCFYIPGMQYMIVPIAFAVWWIVDLRRKYVPVAVYFAVLGLMTAFSMIIQYGENIRMEEREHYEAILNEQIINKMRGDDLPDSPVTQPE